MRRYNDAMNASTDIDYARYDHIRPILWTGDTLQLLDQRKLPFVVEHVECRDSDAVAEAIHALTVRGAPAIGIAAAYGVDMAEAAERLVEGRGWLPSVLRTQAGVPAEAQEAGEGADDETRTAPNDDAYAFAAE